MSANGPGSPRRPPFVRRLWFWAALALTAAVCLGPSPTSRRPSTCAECRMDRTEWRCLGWAWTSEEATDLSLWYQGEVDPEHSHTWVPRGRCERIGITGLYSGFACFMGHRIAGLSRHFQREIYEHFDDPREAGRLFASLASWDDDANARFNSVVEWALEDYPRPWPIWLAEHRLPDDDKASP